MKFRVEENKDYKLLVREWVAATPLAQAVITALAYAFTFTVTFIIVVVCAYWLAIVAVFIFTGRYISVMGIIAAFGAVISALWGVKRWYNENN